MLSVASTLLLKCFALPSDSSGGRMGPERTLQGWDLLNSSAQEWVVSELDRIPPELLLLCPPCTDAGGWFHLNSMCMSIEEVLRRKMVLRKHSTCACGRGLVFYPRWTWNYDRCIKASESSQQLSTASYVAIPVPMAPLPADMQMPRPLATTDGVIDLDHWGRTIITFGKFAGRMMSYAEAQASTEPEVQRYVHGLKARWTKPIEGCLKDLAFYLLAIEQASREQVPIIPGTDVIRHLKGS